MWPLILYIILLTTSFLDPFTSWAGLTGCRLLLAGIALFIAAFQLSKSDAKHFRGSAGFLLIGFAIPMAWIVIQLLPLSNFAHPVWDSARNVIGPSLRGHMSVDLPATWQALSYVSLALMTMLLAGVIALDRAQAEGSLAALTFCAAVRSLTFLFVIGVSGEDPANPVRKAIMLDTAAIGLFLALGCGMLVFERYETRHARQAHAQRRFVIFEALSLLVLMICAGILVTARDDGATVAVFCGIAVFAAIVAIRRLGLGRLSAAVLALGLLAAAGSVIASGAPSLLAYASSSSASLLEQTRRMIQDAPLTGTGAGTFGIMNGLYRGVTDPPVTTGPCLAAVWTIELGRPLFWFLVSAAAALIVLLVRGSLTRGRDSVYPIVGSAVAVTLGATVFINSGLSDPGTSLLASGIAGLAMTQRLSRGNARAN